MPAETRFLGGMSKHTPSPWKIDGTTQSGEIIIRADDCWPALISSFNEISRDPEQAANAKLVASAPDMLAMLERIELQLSGRSDRIIGRLLTETREIIAKATK